MEVKQLWFAGKRIPAMREGPPKNLKTHRAFVSIQKYPVHVLRTFSEIGEEAVERITVN